MIVYKTTNIVNGKIYVGKDTKDDPNYLGSGTYLRNAIKKYGRENFKKETIERCETNEQPCKREIYWIKELDARNTSIGYNISLGGDGWDSQSASIAASLSNSSEKSSKAQKKFWKSLTPEQRSEKAKLIWKNKTSEEHSIIAKKNWEEFTPEEISELRKLTWNNMSKETREKHSKSVKNAWTTDTQRKIQAADIRIRNEYETTH